MFDKVLIYENMSIIFYLIFFLASFSIIFVYDFMLVIVLGIMSLTGMMIYLLLGAPDVAMTEAALGVGLSTVLVVNYLISVGKSKGKNYVSESSENIGDTKNSRNIENYNIKDFRGCIKDFFQYRSNLEYKNDNKNKWVKVVLYFMFFVAIAFLIANNIDWNRLYLEGSMLHDYYVENTMKDIHINSYVASILACYRGFDTLIETCVIFIAGIGMFYVMNIKMDDQSTDYNNIDGFDDNIDKRNKTDNSNAKVDLIIDYEVGNNNFNHMIVQCVKILLMYMFVFALYSQ